MTNSKWFSNEDADPIADIYRRLASLEGSIGDVDRKIANFDSPQPLSRVDPTTYLNPYEGQRAIDPSDEEHMWYSNGAWHKATGTPGPAAMIEWYYVTSSTNWGSGGPTILDFSAINGSWDTSGPTFAINANQNVEILKDGVYIYSVYAVNFGWTGTTVNTIRLEVARLGGEAPAGSHGWGTGSYNDIVRYARQWPTPSSIGAHETLFNAMDFFVFSPGSFPGAGACELSWRATRDEDGTVTADTAPVVHWIIFRLGDEWA